MNPSPSAPAPIVQIPPEGPQTLWCTLYHRDPGFLALAEAELRALGGGEAAEPGVWVSPRPIRWTQCGYGSAGGRQLLFAPTLEAFEAGLRALRLVAPRFSVELRRLPWKLKGASVAKALVGDCIEGAVSVDDPLLRLLLVVTARGYRLLVETPVEQGETAWLGASHKPHNYLVALPVRIAKALVNLTAREGDRVLDPFCGTGTIPLLAAWAGHPAWGSDVSAVCVGHAGENLAHFGQVATLTCVDARETTQQADCIVTNPPYGLYSHFAPDALRAILQNLGRLAPRVTIVTSEHLTPDLEAEGYTVEQVISVEAERFERRVYVTRAPGA